MDKLRVLLLNKNKLTMTPVILTAAAMLIAASAIHAALFKASTNHTFSGTITDLLGNGLSGAQITFINPQGESFTTTSGDGGFYTTTVTHVDDPDIANLENRLALSNPSPNPTRERTCVYLNVPQDGEVILEVYQIESNGRKVTSDVLVNRQRTQYLIKGLHPIILDLNGLDNQHANHGRYAIAAKQGAARVSQKIVLNGDVQSDYRPGMRPDVMNRKNWKQASPKTVSEASSNGKWIMEAAYDGVTTKKYLNNVIEGANTLDTLKMVPNDTTFIKHLDASYRLRGFVLRMSSKMRVFINTDTVASHIQTRILDYLTIDSGGEHNGQFAELTGGLQSYQTSEIIHTGWAEISEEWTAQSDSIWIFDNDGTNSFYIWTDGKGTITACYVSLTEGAIDRIVQQEVGSCMVGVDDYDPVPSMFNDPPFRDTPSDFDRQGFAYCFNRLPGTPGSGRSDDQTQARSLGKALLERKMEERLRALTPAQRAQYNRVVKMAGGRAPALFKFLDTP